MTSLTIKDHVSGSVQRNSSAGWRIVFSGGNMGEGQPHFIAEITLTKDQVAELVSGHFFFGTCKVEASDEQWTLTA